MRRVNLAWRNAAGCNNLGYSKLTLGVELGKHGGEVVAAFLQVHAALDAEVTHRVHRTGVGKPRLGHGLDCRAELALSRLIVKRERVAPLEVAGAGFKLPCRLDRRHLGLGADVIQHHKRHALDVGRRRGQLVRHAVNDERARVGVPRPLGVAHVLAIETWRPRVARRAVLVLQMLALADDGHLAHE